MKRTNLGMYEVFQAKQMALFLCMKHKLNPEKYGITKEQYESMGYTEKDFINDSLENVEEFIKSKLQK